MLIISESTLLPGNMSLDDDDDDDDEKSLYINHIFTKYAGGESTSQKAVFCSPSL